MLNLDRYQQNLNVSHPLVRKAYMKKNAGPNDREKNVLVLDTFSEDETEFRGFDTYLYDLVTDLQNLKEQAEQKGFIVGHIDIRAH